MMHSAYKLPDEARLSKARAGLQWQLTSRGLEKDEPIYLTTNGEGDLVVMTIDHYERLKARVDLFEKLGVAQAQAAAGEKGITHRQMMTHLRRKLHGR